MPLIKLQPKPGVNREVTNYANDGGYYNGDKIRFRFGFAQKIGGWIRNTFAYTYAGVVRTLFNWVTLDQQSLIAVGSNLQYYVQNLSDGQFHPITSSSTRNINTSSGSYAYGATVPVALGSNPMATTSGKSYVVVTDSGLSASITVGTYVTFAGATAVNGITALTLNNAYEIIAILTSTTYVIQTGTAATGTGSGGGASVTAVYTINAGSATYAATTTGGWSIGGWSTGAWSTNTGAYTALNLWSQTNWGQDLIFAQRNGAVYYWTKDTTSYTPALPLNIYAGTQVKTSKSVTANVTSSLTFVVTDTLDIDPGAIITVASGGGTIPVGTYVEASGIWDGSTTITVSAAVTLTTSSVVNFSYSGNTSPTQVLQLVVFGTYQFAVVLGSTPYDPSNFTPTFNPMLVRWSDQSVAADWAATTFNQSGEELLSSGSYIVGGVATRQELLIWTDKALYSMQYIGPPLVFSFQIMMDNISIMSPNAMITVNNITYWMGVDRFYAYSGTVSPIPCTIRQYVFSNLNFTQSFQVVCGQNEAYGEIWWFYPSASSLSNDSYVIFNYMENTWVFGTMNRTAWYDTPLNTYPYGVFSVQNSYLSANVSIGATTLPLINSAAYPVTGSVTVGTETLAYTANSGNVLTLATKTTVAHNQYDAVTYTTANSILQHEYGVDDGSVNPAVALPAFIETSDFDLQGGEHLAYVWRMLPDLTFAGSTAGTSPAVTITLKPRQNQGSAYNVVASDATSVINTVLPSTSQPEQYSGQVYVRVRGRELAMRTESIQLGTTWQLGLTRFDVKPDGRR